MNDNDNSVMKMKWGGAWHELVGKAKQLWGNLSEDDLKVAEGNLEELAGRIATKTGQSAEEVLKKLLP